MDNKIVNQRRILRLGPRLFFALTTLNPWHFLWISILLSEALTALMGLLLKGSVTFDYLVTGGVVSLIVAGIIIFLLKMMMQVRLDNEVLRTEIEKQSETAEGLSKALDFQSLLLETIPDLLFVLNPAGTLIKWNRKAEETTGYSHDELGGKHALVFIAEEYRDAAQAGLEEAYSKGTSARELQLLTKGGKKIAHIFSGAAMRDAEGRFVGFIGTGKDISKLKKMEEELLQTHKLESLATFAGDIAHKFNSLLTSVLENIHFAVIHTDQRKVLREALKKAQAASVQAIDLSKQLVSFSRGGFPVKRSVALGDIIFREFNAFALRDSVVGCNLNICDNLWVAEVDERQIGQVINNIILNFVGAMSGGGTIMITADNIEVPSDGLSTLPGGRYIRISVSDCGACIPSELFQKICDPYFTGKQHESGLALAISYTIIRNHDGHIQVESGPEKGTVFHIYLPAAS
jgi:two-component system, cell cycle sensor histidine kinase and response regulator CckA